MNKRSYQSDNTDKRRRVDISLLNLPTDILVICFQQLSSTDITNLSCVSKQYREELIHFVFNKIKCTWYDLIKLDPLSVINGLNRFISQVRIVDSYSYGEWQIDIFPVLHTYFPNLSRLLVNSSSSSNWLKYRKSNAITGLTLYYEAGHHESEIATNLLSSANNPKRISHKLVSTNAKLFNLFHLDNMPNLTTLTLNNYHFNWENDASSHLTHLSKLSLIDCTWEYPFDLSQFNINNSLTQLLIQYTNNNSFILSERFTKFLENPTNFQRTAIQELSILFTKFDTSWLKPLSTKQLARFIGDNFPNLIYLRLSGWLLNLKNFNSYMSLLEDNNLKVLDLCITDSSSSTDRDNLIHNILQQSRTHFPWMKLALRTSLYHSSPH
ncbi:DEHA2G01012p [Debaryomyces hansenii CBS767]|uniref:DEHA2G01012p n=1 Tax=Debaryomyces hansenii (strain ATCC 36239 / CBS 767 / BCRC 21394 / JCM 1990 / NBRC 0083 / IGC 2968) TaxID=284592 RepID=B5RV07_DEBHA|nr:DEHA2G01012p [Debaryomyces hansenii CBS767]CAR65886.1 DEHA2G01012p [Debaryomyces hansenii CBS767]|eukprot:XP_002770551.1 DEHA2G01012p [Debaryomyces hansenii CBS767]